MADNTDDTPRPGSIPTLFRHSARAEWGLGVVTKHGDERVELMFQDGRSRTLSKNYIHLLQPVDQPLDVMLRLVRTLRGVDESSSPSSPPGVRISVEQQLAYFSTLFPEGMAGPTFESTHRGDETGRSLLRHRNPSVASAKELLNKKALQGLVKEGEFSEVHGRIAKVLQGTDLLAAKERKDFAGIAESFHQDVAESITSLLYGGGDFGERFDAWVSVLSRGTGGEPTWGIVTTLLGLVDPDKYCVIHRTTFERQAVWMAPGVHLTKTPMGVLYQRLNGMAFAVRERIEELGEKPRDMLDVFDFMVLTMKPKARKQMAEDAKNAPLKPAAA